MSTLSVRRQPRSLFPEFAELFADPSLRRKIGEEGRRFADRFSGAKNAETFEKALAGHVPG